MVDQPRQSETESTASGLKVMMRDSPGQFFAEIGTKETTFTAELSSHRMAPDYDGVDAKTVFLKIVDLVAANLAKGPTERAAYSFTGRYAKVPHACDVLSSELFAAVSEGDDSGLVNYEPSSFRSSTDEKLTTRRSSWLSRSALATRLSRSPSSVVGARL